MTAFSQIDTGNGNGETKCLPIPVIKTIIKDLISGDSAKAVLELTEKELILTEQKVFLKDSVIYSMSEKEKNYKSNIDLSDKKYLLLLEYNNNLENNYKKVNLQLKVEKTKNKIKGVIITSGFTIAIGYAAYWFLFLK